MKKPKKLFEITMKAYKAFYVEAESQEEAYEMDVVQEESETRTSFQKADWEHEYTSAKECDEKWAGEVRLRQSKSILNE